MVVSCSGFTTLTECGLTLTNEYNIKLIVLTIILLYSLGGFIIYEKIPKEKSYMHFWGYYLTKVLSIGYLIFSPMFYLLLLNSNLSLEIFITIIIAFYLVLTALFIGMAIYGGSSQVFKIFGFDDWNELKDEMRDRRSMKKYG